MIHMLKRLISIFVLLILVFDVNAYTCLENCIESERSESSAENHSECSFDDIFGFLTKSPSYIQHVQNRLFVKPFNKLPLLVISPINPAIVIYWGKQTQQMTTLEVFSGTVLRI